MIGRLRGVILEKRPPLLVLDVGGVGYELEAPMPTFYELPAVGETATLFTHFSVKEDAHSLYGFFTERERSLFRSLIKISGVGPRMALTVLSGIRAADFIRCIEHQDVGTLTRLPGIGKKTAERLLLEMRDRIKDLLSAPAPRGAPSVVGALDDPQADAVSALLTLGYKAPDAARWVREVGDAGATTEQIIRLALQKAVH